MNSKPKSLKLNFIMNAILTMSSFIFPLITFPYVTRVLGPGGTGSVSFASSTVTYFAMAAQLGIPTYGIRICAQEKDNKLQLSRTAQELLIINTAMSAAVYAIFLVLLVAVPAFREEKPLLLIFSSTVWFNTIGAEWLYRALEQYSYITARSVIFKFIAVIFTFIFIRSQNDYVIYGAVTVFAASASNILNFIRLRKHIFLRPVGSYDIRRHLRPIFIFFAMSCATTIYTSLDAVMIGFMKTKVDVGYYDAAVKIKNILVSVITSLGAVLLPRASYYIAHGQKDEFYRISKKAINFVMLISLPLMTYFMLFAVEGTLFLSGNEYVGSIVPMRIIMPTLIFIGLSNLIGIQMLIPLGKEKVVLFSEIVGALVDLIINAALIPKMAATGAAIGTLVAEAVVFAVQYAFLHKDVAPALKSVRYWAILLGLAAGVGASFWLKFFEDDIRRLLIMIISAILFFAAYGLVLLITREPLLLEILGQVKEKIKGFLHRSGEMENRS